MGREYPEMEDVISLTKRRGFIFAGSEIYGGLSNSWDYGPLGVELRRNIKNLWWETFVHRRRNMTGVDAAIMMNSKVWEASGHTDTFHDPLVDCRSCQSRFRADHLAEEIDKTVDELNFAELPCPKCGKKELTEPRNFNMMFKTHIGPLEGEGNEVYLRPETAQGIFTNFKNVMDTQRPKIPFGIGQIGKAFRNEITPGNFTFRTLEFEQMEIEYFVRESEWEESFEQWHKDMYAFGENLGLDKERLHDLEVVGDDLAHYSKRTVDVEFDFPFGRKELWGLAYRGDFDLKQHTENSDQKLEYFDQATNERFMPHVIEPTMGVDRTLLAVLLSAYEEEEITGVDGKKDTRTVLHLPPALAPYTVAVLPLSKKDELKAVADPLYEELQQLWNVEYDETQSIGKRYRRQDEIGTPFCVTVDFDSLEDKAVTIRDRDTMKQERIPITEVVAYIQEQIK